MQSSFQPGLARKENVQTVPGPYQFFLYAAWFQGKQRFILLVWIILHTESVEQNKIKKQRWLLFENTVKQTCLSFWFVWYAVQSKIKIILFC